MRLSLVSGRARGRTPAPRARLALEPLDDRINPGGCTPTPPPDCSPPPVVCPPPPPPACPPPGDNGNHYGQNKCREHGNNGVGNGLDPQPPGNPPVNDGPGTSPGS